MKLRGKIIVLMSFSTLALVTLVALGCNDKSTGPDNMVTIRGNVRNVDTGELAQGIKVSQLGTTYADVIETGSDGAYEIKVPKGTVLRLYTDDFNPANDVWFPLINVDVPPVTADADMSDWPIHSCLQTVCNPPTDTLGSVGTWNNYLENGDASNGNLFVPTTAMASGGVLSPLFLRCNSGVPEFIDGMHVDVDAAEFPLGYTIGDRVWGDDGVPNCQLGPDCVYPASASATDPGGWIWSFGDPAFTDSIVTLTVTDTVSGRGYNWPSAVVPVRPGTISLLLYCVVDDISGKSFKELGDACGLFGP